jgi:hypothetical protein
MADLILQQINPASYRSLQNPPRFLKDEYVGLPSRSSASSLAEVAICQVENVIHFATSACALYNRFIYVIASLGGLEGNQRKFLEQHQIRKVEQPMYHLGMRVRWDRQDERQDIVW